MDNNKYLIRATGYYQNTMETLKDTMEQAVEVSKEWALDGWSVEILQVPDSYIDDLTKEALGYVSSLGPTYH